MENISDRIKKIRIDNDLTLDQFAKKFGFSNASVASRWEKNPDSISINLMKQLIQEFNVSADYLLFGESDINETIDYRTMTTENIKLVKAVKSASTLRLLIVCVCLGVVSIPSLSSFISVTWLIAISFITSIFLCVYMLIKIFLVIFQKNRSLNISSKSILEYRSTNSHHDQQKSEKLVKPAVLWVFFVCFISIILTTNILHGVVKQSVQSLIMAYMLVMFMFTLMAALKILNNIRFNKSVESNTSGKFFSTISIDILFVFVLLYYVFINQLYLFWDEFTSMPLIRANTIFSFMYILLLFLITELYKKHLNSFVPVIIHNDGKIEKIKL